jgi:hypothetical protein
MSSMLLEKIEGKLFSTSIDLLTGQENEHIKNILKSIFRHGNRNETETER